jgi:flavorubredoxin
MTDTATAVGGIVELVPGRLYRLGGAVAADSGLSWMPEGRLGYEPINAYLLLEPDRAVMVDTGVALHGDAVVAQLKTLLPPQIQTLSVFATRLELDTVGNLGRLTEVATLDAVYAGGVSNPFDFFEELEAGAIVDNSVKLVRMTPDVSERLSDARELRLTRTLLKLLQCWWVWDEATGTLFTSDSFGYVRVEDPDDVPLTTTLGDLTEQQVYEHVTCKFDWLPGARTDKIRENLHSMFEGREVVTLAPGHGCIVQGSEPIAELVRMVDAALVRAEQEVPV